MYLSGTDVQVKGPPVYLTLFKMRVNHHFSSKRGHKRHSPLRLCFITYIVLHYSSLCSLVEIRPHKKLGQVRFNALKDWTIFLFFLLCVRSWVKNRGLNLI